MGSLLTRSKYHDIEKADPKTFMIRNGKTVLEKLIASSNGKYNPIRSFSAEELKTATNNYHRQNVVIHESHYRVYRGFLQDRAISVMQFVDDGFWDAYQFCLNNIVFASQMSHKNVLRLIGCCLGVEIPVLVFESMESGTLGDCLNSPRRSHFEPLLVKQRLKIAKEIANVIAYLHMGFSRPIVFRDLTSRHIVLCEDYVPKLFNFRLTESIPEGETHIHDPVRGTSGIAAPEYIITGSFNEKSDVYTFGLLLLQLLSKPSTCFREMNGGETYEKEYIENCLFDGKDIVGEDESLEQQLRASVELGFKCKSLSAEDRPTMMDVAKQLRQICQSI